MSDTDIAKMVRENEQMKQIIEEILYYSVTQSGGYYSTIFGPATCGRMLEITKYDMNKREIYLKKK